MSGASDQSLLSVLLDSWDRNNSIMLNLLRALPEDGTGGQSAGGQPLRRAAVDAHPPRAARVRLRGGSRVRQERTGGRVAGRAWRGTRRADADRKRQGGAGRGEREGAGRSEPGPQLRPPDPDAPALALHEGYHHGQIKLALKVAGYPICDDEAGAFTWDVWRRKGVER